METIKCCSFNENVLQVVKHMIPRDRIHAKSPHTMSNVGAIGQLLVISEPCEQPP